MSTTTLVTSIHQRSLISLSLTVALACSASLSAEEQLAATGIERVSVVGTSPHRYQTTSGDSLVGLPLDYLELPRIIDVLPEQLLLDQKVTELEEALRNIPGVSLSDGFGGSNNDYLVRGFRRNTIYRDGMRIASNFRANTANLDSIRVIKGPASVTYGQVEPGGLVDIITKKPLDEQRVYTELRAGSWSNYLLQADVSTPIGEDAAVRVNISSQDAGYFRDNFDIEKDIIALTGRYDVSENTRISTSYEYRDEFRSFDRGTLSIPTANGRVIVNKITDIPLSRRFGEAFEEIDTQFEFATLKLDHSFANGWALNVAAAWESSMSNDLQVRPVAVIILDADAPISNGFFTAPVTPEAIYDEDDDQIFLTRGTDGSRERDQHVSYLSASINGEVMTGSVNHRIVVGVDRRRFNSSRYFVTTPTTTGTQSTGPLFDLRNPVYGNLPDSLSTENGNLVTDETEDFGIYINDYINFTDSLALLIGGRQDYSDVDGDDEIKDVNAFSPQVALNYKPSANISTFVSYSEAFEPNTVLSFDNSGAQSETELYPAENSTQYEAGVKAQFFNSKLNGSVSVYDIEKENVLTVGADGLPALVKGQDSQGLEISISGQPVPGWTIVSGYAYTDASIKTGSNAGNRPSNVAKSNASLWTSYEFTQGQWTGLGAGTGVFYMGDRFGDNANSWNLGSYTTCDLSVWYTLPLANAKQNMRFQLSVKNLFNETYYSASGGDLRINIGQPRSVFASVSATF
ncbi:TonB-dependent siderophore receptor [Rheinheimera sp. YQF-2]|uniref:TonB-dependent siderophore receptor n=1 Tax=Rheinheimera lutimaris TaxID=2740584 RepID=A0A7Y5AMY8_9GAMM|nr:TonB-dependent siderophore receptor [Rheinheimera lutimaris]NRQ41351.1 TonB-dependent siderophore receptor [Rheinheimera lutimaris]